MCLSVPQMAARGDADQDFAGAGFRDRTIADFGPFRTVERG